MPSTPGAAETEASLVAARHALETLAMSERNGCALGAATASSATGGRSAACSTGPQPASASNPGAVASRRSIGRRRHRTGRRNPGQRSGARVRRRAAAAAAPRFVRSARSAGRSPRRILSLRPRGPARPARSPALTRVPARPALGLPREEKPRSEHYRAQHEIGREGDQWVPQHAGRERDAQERGLKPKSSPIASHTPRIVCDRRGSATGFCCVSIIHSVGEISLPITQQEPCQTRKCLSANSLGESRASSGKSRHPHGLRVGNSHLMLQVR